MLAMPAIEVDDDGLVPADLLRFTRGTGEGGESGWCLVRNRKQRKGRSKPGTGELAICELDDRFGMLGNPVPFDFWGFLDRYLTGDRDGELPTVERY
jgi:hypothetical protein